MHQPVHFGGSTEISTETNACYKETMPCYPTLPTLQPQFHHPIIPSPIAPQHHHTITPSPHHPIAQSPHHPQKRRVRRTSRMTRCQRWSHHHLKTSWRGRSTLETALVSPPHHIPPHISPPSPRHHRSSASYPPRATATRATPDSTHRPLHTDPCHGTLTTLTTRGGGAVFHGKVVHGGRGSFGRALSIRYLGDDVRVAELPRGQGAIPTAWMGSGLPEGVVDGMALDDPAVGDAFPLVWTDPLFGTRGTTPVSVQEWSKGVAVNEEKLDVLPS